MAKIDSSRHVCSEARTALAHYSLAKSSEKCLVTKTTLSLFCLPSPPNELSLWQKRSYAIFLDLPQLCRLQSNTILFTPQRIGPKKKKRRKHVFFLFHRLFLLEEVE
ncbi:hypothetical protein JTE90_022275 [Oedothorax gibbosus]|uniref:Uncharacterized protein n=1 Tax=Oedothorax gibbosus TaxID=931172 RepID=A0AAV6VV85_9ARAC|nr:hypothetical protein JTE90_022275 [Oedothorax gibbosus]